jgi:DNA polymerase-3 subunit epsilon
MLEGKPWIDDVLPEFEKFVEDSIVVGHNVNFDVNFLYEDYETVLKRPFKNNFIDTMRIARKLYPELSHHRLIDIVEHLNIKGSATHRALNDCEYTYKCYEAMKNEIERRYVSFEYFSTQFKKTDLTKLTAENDEFDETNPLYKKQCVFTGTLERYSRQEAAQIVVNSGGTCGNTVTKKTNFLILGNNSYCSSIKDGKSSKQKKAEEYKLKGQDIEVIPENVFYEMIEQK